MLAVLRLYLYLAGMAETSEKTRITPDRQRAISSLGGKAAHAKGTAHEFTSEEAAEAGRKGGRAAWALNRAHKFTSETASAAGRRGAAARQAARLAAAYVRRPRVSTRVPVADLLTQPMADLQAALGVSRQWIGTARKVGVSPRTRERWAQLLTVARADSAVPANADTAAPSTPVTELVAEEA